MATNENVAGGGGGEISTTTTITTATTTSLSSSKIATVESSLPITSSSSSSTYKLQFESYYKHLSNSLVRLLAEQHYCDCHISTGFHRPLIRAHRLILSSFSPYFQQLFDSLQITSEISDKPGSTYFPIIIIKDFSYETICHIVEFCYQ
ncbi:protein bric-a-brac 2-like, partial [Dermatophagoides pteronyssinus]|uniref:protein bric-a-brac 2-like n=1 Tax=Dermatophagoides pteronyssinus TaxID=6956 RepID=UPI003F668F79